MARFQGNEIRCIRGERLVLDGTSFDVASGDVLVLRGANGSGKSTLLRLMAGLLRPGEGSVSWDGEDITEDPGAHNARMSYIGHADAVKPALTVRENVQFWGDVAGGRGMSPDDAANALGIPHLMDLPARYLSAGQRRRVNLSRMLTGGADLWLLDEPTTALDADANDVLKGLIGAHVEKGGMAVISTHTPLGLERVHELNLTDRP